MIVASQRIMILKMPWRKIFARERGWEELEGAGDV